MHFFFSNFVFKPHLFLSPIFFFFIPTFFYPHLFLPPLFFNPHIFSNPIFFLYPPFFNLSPHCIFLTSPPPLSFLRFGLLLCYFLIFPHTFPFFYCVKVFRVSLTLVTRGPVQSSFKFVLWNISLLKIPVQWTSSQFQKPDSKFWPLILNFPLLIQILLSEKTAVIPRGKWSDL